MRAGIAEKPWKEKRKLDFLLFDFLCIFINILITNFNLNK